MKETPDVRIAREWRDKCLADLKRVVVGLPLWFLGFLLSALWLYPRLPDSLWPLRFLPVITAIGLFLSLVATYEAFSEWKGAQSRFKEKYQEWLDEAMPLKKARPAGQKKKPKGGQK